MPALVDLAIPELEGLPDHARRRIAQHALRDAPRDNRAIYAVIVVSLAIVLLVQWSWRDVLAQAVHLATLPLLTLVWLTIFFGQVKRRERRLLRRRLRQLYPDGRVNWCIRCDYDLRGSPGPNCPECGEAIYHVAVAGQ